MADLYIDFAGLDDTRDAMKHVESLLAKPLATMNGQAGSATGIGKLRDKLQDFGDEWSYGIDKLGDFTGGCAEALEKIKSTFQELDQKLAEALTSEGE